MTTLRSGYPATTLRSGVVRSGAAGSTACDTRPEVLENEREADGGDHDRQEGDDRQGLLPSLRPEWLLVETTCSSTR